MISYEICPRCHLMTYSARLRLMADEECPRCGARLDQAASSCENPVPVRMTGHRRGWLTALADHRARRGI
jgi:uncharacterized paraquat-inducible protein A